MRAFIRARFLAQIKNNLYIDTVFSQDTNMPASQSKADIRSEDNTAFIRK
jgi:hypothetical protein